MESDRHLREADKKVVADQHVGWTSFELRGTYLSRNGQVPSGALDLYALTQYWVSLNDGSTKYEVKIRDLSNKIEPDLEFTAERAHFKDALASAFVDLCKSYPEGRMTILGEDMGTDSALQPAPTGKMIGFDLPTTSAWKRFKSKFYNPVVQTLLNAAAMAVMIVFPPSAPFVMATLAATTIVNSIDDLVTRRDKGTLGYKELTLDLAEIGLSVLPAARGARFLGPARETLQELKGASWRLFAFDAVNIAGQVLVMTERTRQVIGEIQDKQIGGLAERYRKLLELENQQPNASDPRLATMRAEIDRDAKAIRDTVITTWAHAVANQSTFLIGAHMIGPSSGPPKSHFDDHPGNAPVKRRPDADDQAKHDDSPAAPAKRGQDPDPGGRPKPADPDSVQTGAAERVGDFKGRVKRDEGARLTDQQVHVEADHAVRVLGGDFAHAAGVVTIRTGGREVKVKIINSPGTNIDAATHTYKPGDKHATITLTLERPQDAARAIAHELGEIRALIENPGLATRPDALKKGSESRELSAHDRGRLAELDVLLDQHARATSDQERASIKRELDELLDHLGIDPSKKGFTNDPRVREIFGIAETARLEAVTTRLDVGVVDSSKPPLGTLDLEATRARIDTMVGKVDAELKTLESPGTKRGVFHATRLDQLRTVRDKLDKAKARTDLEKLREHLVLIGREYNVTGLQSLEQVGVAGHQHDSFLYKILADMSKDYAPGATRTDTGRLSVGIEKARSAYQAALASPPTIEMLGTRFSEFRVGDHRLVVDHTDGYVYPRAALTKDATVKSLHKTFGYESWQQLPAKKLAFIAGELAAGRVYTPAQELAMFFAGMVAEPSRNHVAEITNRILLGDPAGRNKPAFENMPMTTGGTSSGARDRSLDSGRSGSSLSRGEVTDREITLIKDRFEADKGKSMTTYIAAEGGEAKARPEIIKHIRNWIGEELK